ncbi:MAG: hypothetical protein LUH14_03980 [Clostridiaceae bacterium]|nr:hypothetical protein [Clostridiaceae bacterium]
MYQNHKRISTGSVLIIILLFIPIAYAAYLLAGALTYYPGKPISVLTIYAALQEEISSPSDNYYNQYTIPFLLAVFSVYVLLWWLHILTRHSLMVGKEYGDSKFADPRQINNTLADTSKSSDTILVKTKLVKLKKRR